MDLTAIGHSGRVNMSKSAFHNCLCVIMEERHQNCCSFPISTVFHLQPIFNKLCIVFSLYQVFVWMTQTQNQIVLDNWGAI